MVDFMHPALWCRIVSLKCDADGGKLYRQSRQTRNNQHTARMSETTVRLRRGVRGRRVVAVFRMVTFAAGDNPGLFCKAEHHFAKKCERSANAQDSDPIFSTDFHVSLLLSLVKTILQPYCDQS
jgi:hypothetical protein